MSQNTENVITKYWPYALAFLSFLYLLFELSFNYRLVELSLDITNREYVELLALEGRILSGIGCVLILWKFFVKPRKTSTRKTFILLLITAAIGFPSMFYGQKILIDDYIDRSTAEERLNAQYLSLLKQGLALNAVQLSDVSINAEELETPEAKTFLSTIGFMTFFSQNFIDILKNNESVIINKIAENQSYLELESSYKDYVEAQNKIAEGFSGYQEIKNGYNKTTQDINSQVEKEWQNIQKSLYSSWKDNQSKLNEKNLLDMTDKFLKNWPQYRRGVNSCGQRQECLSKMQQKYRSIITGNFGQYIEPEYWCLPPEKTTKTIRVGPRTVTREVMLPPVCDDLEYDYIKTKIRNLLAHAENFEEYLELPVTKNAVIKKLQDKGINMPENWTLDNKDVFIELATSPAQEKALKKVEDVMIQNFGYLLPLDLDKQSFPRHESIQNHLNEELGFEKKQDIEMGLEPENFRERVLLPLFIEKAYKQKEAFSKNSENFKDGGNKEEEGKAYVRGLIIPPVAMAFSLFFGLLNLATLIADIPGLIFRSFLKYTPYLRIACFVIIILVPFTVRSDLSESKAFMYFQGETSTNISPIMSSIVKWTMNMQPIIYPLGKNSASFTPLFVDILGISDNQENRHNA